MDIFGICKPLYTRRRLSENHVSSFSSVLFSFCVCAAPYYCHVPLLPDSRLLSTNIIQNKTCLFREIKLVLIDRIEIDVMIHCSGEFNRYYTIILIQLVQMCIYTFSCVAAQFARQNDRKVLWATLCISNFRPKYLQKLCCEIGFD